jgi:GNAT superfamily N-acetyltransferase
MTVDPITAAAVNHQSWSAALAAVAGGTVQPLGSGTVTYLPTGGGDLQVLYADQDGEDAEVGGTVDRVLEQARSLGSVRELGWWASGDGGPLGGRLLARGFQWGWRPRWMACELARWSGDWVPPAPVVIEEAAGDVRWNATDLPYHDVPWERRFSALLRHRPGRTRILFARRQDAVLGKIVLHVQPDGAVAGLYECGVVEAARRQGIGTALTAAALRAARETGSQLAVLNATPMGEPLYLRVGFTPTGWGQTWWMLDGRASGPPPPPTLVALVEAIADQDRDRLRAALAAVSAGGFDIDARLGCGLRPLEVAARLGCDESAQVLVAHGAHLDVLTAWDLGWHERAAELLQADPGAAGRPRGEEGATLLHLAVERDDEALLRLLLAGHPDLDVRDGVYHGTPLAWAEHQGRPHLAALLRERPPGPAHA